MSYGKERGASAIDRQTATVDLRNETYQELHNAGILTHAEGRERENQYRH